MPGETRTITKEQHKRNLVDQAVLNLLDLGEESDEKGDLDSDEEDLLNEGIDPDLDMYVIFSQYF